ncbi:unnamed protein product [Prorocentrum cordatum]|uniref:Uncharacterized protein n=1 Tax=Prorocentrum cordatum TaxID=2364126 RepID=A0ABN9T8Z0_9DINO|nr:unnamed protein product [Polarella glacialis]
MPAAPAKTGGHAPLFGRLLALAAAGAAGASATAGVPRAVLDGGAGTNASLRVPEDRDARCLLWQGGELGCGAVRDRDVCLRTGGADGRPWMQWRGHRIYGQPCAWCGGENCTASTGELCMPADWVRGRPRIEVAGCGLAPRARARASAERHGGGLLAAPPAGPAAYGLVQFEGPGRSGFACGAEGAAASAKVLRNHLLLPLSASVP